MPVPVVPDASDAARPKLMKRASSSARSIAEAMPPTLSLDRPQAARPVLVKKSSSSSYIGCGFLRPASLMTSNSTHAFFAAAHALLVFLTRWFRRREHPGYE